MPNVVGQVLQDAQEALHADGVFYSRSHDLRGVRHQVLDRDWKVCSQNLPAGQQVTAPAEGKIDFGVVKLSETCP
jgi:beta-lactam-binding protein with PASTA domain